MYGMSEEPLSTNVQDMSRLLLSAHAVLINYPILINYPVKRLRLPIITTRTGTPNAGLPQAAVPHGVNRVRQTEEVTLEPHGVLALLLNITAALF